MIKYNIKIAFKKKKNQGKVLSSGNFYDHFYIAYNKPFPVSVLNSQQTVVAVGMAEGQEGILSELKMCLLLAQLTNYNIIVFFFLRASVFNITHSTIKAVEVSYSKTPVAI